MKSFKFMTKTRGHRDELTNVLSSLDENVAKIEKELEAISENILLNFDQKSMQYKSSDELWRYYKYARDQHNYLLAYFTLVTFERGLKEWKLHKRVDPLSPYFKEFKKAKARYKRLKDEKSTCHRGILFDLLGRCISEKIYLAEPVSGAAEPSPKPSGSPSGKYIENKFSQEFALSFDPVEFCKTHKILPASNAAANEKMVNSTDDSAELVTAEVIGNEDTSSEVAKSAWYKFTKSKKRITNKRHNNIAKTASAPTRGKLKVLKLKTATPATMLDCEFDNKNITLERKACKIFRVRSDNHGMFRAMAFSMALGNTTVQQEARAIYKLREVTCNELLRSCEEPFMSDGTTVKQMMVKKSSLKIEEVGLVNVVCDYYRKMLFRKKPGSLELWALSRALQRKITVFDKVIIDKTRKTYAKHFKHSATYGVSLGEEVFLYKNGKGEYASLLMEKPAPNEPTDFDSLLHPTDKRKKSVDIQSDEDVDPGLDLDNDDTDNPFQDILEDNEQPQEQAEGSGSATPDIEDTEDYLEEELLFTPTQQAPVRRQPSAKTAEIDF